MSEEKKMSMEELGKTILSMTHNPLTGSYPYIEEMKLPPILEKALKDHELKVWANLAVEAWDKLRGKYDESWFENGKLQEDS